MLVNPVPPRASAGKSSPTNITTKAFADGLSNATQASILTRFLANVVAFAVLLVALGVVTWEVVTGQPVNSYALVVLSTGLGYVINLLALNTGVTLQPLLPPQIPHPAPPAQAPDPGKTSPLP